MLHSFSCKNFYSVSEPSVVRFTVNEKAPNNKGYFVEPSGTRLSKVETVIGPNASGKTNLLKVLPFLKWLIIDSFNISPSDLLPVKPFMFGGLHNQPVELSSEFEIGGNIYTYSFILNTNRILSEELRIKNKTSKKTTSKSVFYRKWNDKTEQYEFRQQKFGLPKGFGKLIRSNASVIAVATRLNHKKSSELSAFWQLIETNVIEAGWIGDHLLPNAPQHLLEAFDFYSENETLKKEAEKLLSRFDLGLDSFDIEKKKDDNGVSFNIKVAHSFNGEKGFLPLSYESAGTKQLFILLKTILQVLNKGGIAVLDEFDVNLHSEMVLSLFDLFIQTETNPHNAQLLFSTHSLQVLSKLDKYQIVLIEKNSEGQSEVWRLDEITGIRPDDNYYSKYIAGAYGAVPKL